MLPIFFLAFAFICHLPKTAAVPSRSLQYYDADSELDVKTIKEWYDMVKTPLDEETSLDELKKEASEAGKRGSVMNEFLRRAIKFNSCDKVPDLTRAECLVVTMYTAGNSETPFHSEYNAASINKEWQPYKVYTTLFMSALQKLARIYPIPKDTILYRGINYTPERPSAKHLFLKRFSSTSLNLKTAQEFAGSEGMILEFHPPHSRYAARVNKLSALFHEDEVILPPFIAFDLLNADGSDSHFKFETSEVQVLLPPIPSRKASCGF